MTEEEEREGESYKIDKENRKTKKNQKIRATMKRFKQYVTGSGKRDIFAQTMIFQYKRCCSKNVILFIIQKKIFWA